MEASPKTARAGIVGIVFTVLVSAGIMLYLRFSGMVLFDLPFEQRIDHEITYQVLTLGLMILVVLAVRLLGGPGSLQYLKLTNLDGPVTPVHWLGLNPGPGETWVKVGLNFLIVITVVTTVVIYFQVFRGNEVFFSMSRVILPALGFAVINSLIEEGIFRFSIVGVFLSKGLSVDAAAYTSGAIFGAVHYFGTPGGIPGVLMAAFIGWFLARSIAETRSFAWAWIIHGVQDVVIFTAFFATRFPMI